VITFTANSIKDEIMTIKKFEDLEVWQRSINLDRLVHALIESNERLKRQYALCNQMNRSSGSIADNIAEGFERSGNREFVQFLSIAKGSCGELRSQFWRCNERGLIDLDTANECIQECLIISSSIAGLMRHLQYSEYRGAKFKNR
jgi:four helix bundle protein